MEQVALQVSKFDRDVSTFLDALGFCLQQYRGPGLCDSIDQIASGMGTYGKQLVIELAKKIQTGS